MTNKKEYAKEYYKKNREIIIQRACEWNKKHHEKHLEHARTCRMNNPDYRKTYYQNNKERSKKQTTEWRRAHPDKVKEYARNYRLKKKKGGLNG